MTEGALAGIKVLDLIHHVAGPYCTKLLADFGAEVIKVERPGSGDPARRIGPFVGDRPDPDGSLLFLYLNTSKKSVTLDIKSKTGGRILKRLAGEADLVVENFRPRVLPALGLDFESLKEANPGLAMVSISNFGQTGPYRDYEATDMVEYALAGLMYIIGSNRREPLKHALNQAQFKAGTIAAAAANTALYRRQMTGRGQWMDISIHECLASALRDTVSLYSYMGAVRRRQPDYVGDLPRNPIETKDGYLVPVAFGQLDWEKIADLLDEPSLREKRFSTAEGRLENAIELDGLVAGAIGRKRTVELVEDASQHRGFIFGAVQSPADVADNLQYKDRDYFREIDHLVAGPISYPGAPLVMSATPWQPRSPAPTLGHHNREVLSDGLGYTVEELALLRASGVV